MEKILLNGVEWKFALEIVGRTIIMFLLIILVLRLSGKRGVRQLSLFEVAIILGLGSAAGDPMFQEDIPVLYAVVVLFSTVFIYKFITWSASKSLRIHRILEGKEMIVVENGQFDVKHENDKDFSVMEFFSELRNQSVEHLGQVRLALLEIDGTLSTLFYADEDVRYGLPLFPGTYKLVQVDETMDHPIACMYCGFVQQPSHSMAQVCERCKHKEWTIAINTKRIN